MAHEAFMFDILRPLNREAVHGRMHAAQRWMYSRLLIRNILSAEGLEIEINNQAQSTEVSNIRWAQEQQSATQQIGHFSCAGAELDPLQVLSALPDSMPLTAGADILARMMCERMHRHRQGSIVRSLQKSVHLSTIVQRVEVSYVQLLLCS